MTATTSSAPSRLDHVVDRVATFFILMFLAFIAGGLVLMNVGLPKFNLAKLNLFADPHFDPVMGFGMVIFVLVVHALFVAPRYRSADTQ